MFSSLLFPCPCEAWEAKSKGVVGSDRALARRELVPGRAKEGEEAALLALVEEEVVGDSPGSVQAQAEEGGAQGGEEHRGDIAEENEEEGQPSSKPYFLPVP